MKVLRLVAFPNSLVKIASGLLDFGASLFFPQSCQICGREVESISLGITCRNCWNETFIFTKETPICYKCSRPLQINSRNEEKIFCHACEDDYFDVARSIGLYEKALMKTVLHLKKTPFLARYVQDLLYQTFRNAPFQNANLIIPVPLSKVRLVERGFNQAELIAMALARKTKIPMDTSSLIRIRHTQRHRPGMDKIARQKLVKEAFAVLNSRKILGKKIVLTDDVLTSGATVSNCAKVLKENGASEVYVLTLVRASN
jgi:competence protein ComFC